MESNQPQPIDYSRPIVFFDGGCPLCSREIAHYRRLDKHRMLRWLDITGDGGQASRYGIEPVDLMRRFHVLDARGNWQTGAWGFAEMWGHLPYYRWLSLGLRFSRLLPALDWLYDHFARLRMRRRCVDQCLPPRA